MKQQITPKQLTELTHEQKIKLHSIWNPQEGEHYVWYISKKNVGKKSYLVRDVKDPIDDPEAIPKLFALPLLSIGRMIEIMLDKRDQTGGFYETYQLFSDSVLIRRESNDLCDELWNQLKKII